MATDEKKRGRGRPSLGDEARTKLITIRVSDEDDAIFRSKAAAAGYDSPGVWLRDLGLEAIGNDPVEPDRAELEALRRRVEEQRELNDALEKKLAEIRKAGGW